jgi:diguanylate cyclase (GGDEF)-like protein
MTIAMVLLCTMLVIMADMFFGVLHAGHEKEQAARKQIGESISVQVAGMLRDTDSRKVRDVLEGIVRRSSVIQSIGLRAQGGELLLQAGNHRQNWTGKTGKDLALNEMIVSLDSNKQSWGQLEYSFVDTGSPYGLSFLRDPMFITVVFLLLFGGPAFWLYMRRALQYLDPTSVIPERVQAAFDAMSEGVVIVDSNGRILLVSRSFRAMNPTGKSVNPGVALSSLEWLALGLSTDVADHPWIQAMNQNESLIGRTLILSTPDETRHLVIGCSPVHGDDESVRGCLVTFSDVSELHAINETLVEANQALSDSQKDVHRKNLELQRLATRDPLTGCLNRRAFFESLEELVAIAHRDNTPMSCIMLDIDRFKSVNDTHGHSVGDRVIQEVARPLLELTRSTDLVSRYGGEEFCVVLPGLPRDGALRVSEQIRRRIEEQVGTAVDELEPLSLTVSIGVDSATGTDIEIAQMIDQADQSLYEAKRSGRNRVCGFLREVKIEPRSEDQQRSSEATHDQ